MWLQLDIACALLWCIVVPFLYKKPGSFILKAKAFVPNCCNSADLVKAKQLLLNSTKCMKAKPVCPETWLTTDGFIIAPCLINSFRHLMAFSEILNIWSTIFTPSSVVLQAPKLVSNLKKTHKDKKWNLGLLAQNHPHWEQIWGFSEWDFDNWGHQGWALDPSALHERCTLLTGTALSPGEEILLEAPNHLTHNHSWLDFK